MSNNKQSMGDMQFNGTPEEWEALVNKNKMSNNKQSSVEMMWDEIDNLISFKDSATGHKFCALLGKYKAMHKEEIIKSWMATDNELQRISAEQYYKETYGGNK
jgi:hypothetical protein